MSSLLLAERPWHSPALDGHPVTAGTMLDADELRYLFWLARECYTGRGAIVDAGPLLGASTVAFAEGIRQNPRIADTAARIHSYDLFEYASYMRSLFADEPLPRNGESLVPWFLANTGPWRASIELHAGDVRRFGWDGGPIEILFIDLAKSWDIQSHLLRTFFPHLIPGVSVVVQQDYFHYCCYWIAVVMEYLADYFEPVHPTEAATLGFLVKKAIPLQLLQQISEHRFTQQEGVALMDRAIARFSGMPQFLLMTAKASLLLDHNDIEAAANLLETLRRSPHYGPRAAWDFAGPAERVKARLTERRGGSPHTASSSPDTRFALDLVPDATTPLATIDLAVVADDGRVVPQLAHAKAEPIRIAVIDGSHSHPWPAANLLALLPALAPEAWIVLSDIRWPLIDPSCLGGFGSAYLFHAWPGEKRRGGTDGNLGAIRVPRDVSLVPGMLAAGLQEPWEAVLPDDLRAALRLEPASYAPRRERALRLIEKAVSSGRPLYLWGAGQGGRYLLDFLRQNSVPVAGFVDRDPRKHGLSVDGLTVSPPAMLDRAARPRPYIAVSGDFAVDIVAGLTTGGWIFDRDYVVLRP